MRRHPNAEPLLPMRKTLSIVVPTYCRQKWRQMGRRSLSDVVAAEADLGKLRISGVNALSEGRLCHGSLPALGCGVAEWLP